MQITCLRCDTPFESTRVQGKYIFCPWCGKRLLNPRYSEKKASSRTTSSHPDYGSLTRMTSFFDEKDSEEKMVDIFGRPIDPNQLMPKKRSKIRLFFKRS